jgi:hypothetical protein
MTADLGLSLALFPACISAVVKAVTTWSISDMTDTNLLHAR